VCRTALCTLHIPAWTDPMRPMARVPTVYPTPRQMNSGARAAPDDSPWTLASVGNVGPIADILRGAPQTRVGRVQGASRDTEREQGEMSEVSRERVRRGQGHALCARRLT
jgi:hypothetical protein